MVTVSPGGDRNVPPTPIDASHPTAQEAWHQWWASGIPQALEISPHDPELLAWIRAKNDHAVLREMYMQNPRSAGSRWRNEGKPARRAVESNRGQASCVRYAVWNDA